MWPKFAGIDEQHFPAPIAEAAVPLVARQKPQACRDLRRIESCPGNAIMQSTTSPSIMARRISSSPLWPDDIDPFESTTPAVP